MVRSCLFAAAAISAAILPSSASTKPSAAAAASDPTQQYAKCAVQRYEGAELLATQPGSPEEAEVLAEYGRRSCAAPSSNSGLLRGVVAEQLFKDDFGAIGSQPTRDSIEIFTVDSSELEAMDANGKKRLEMVAFGTCVAAAYPAKSTELLQTGTGSPAESKLIAEIQPAFSSCLSEGDQLRLEKPELRGVVAEGVYRLALTYSLDQVIVVTGTLDPSRSITCKMQEITASRFRRKICLTEAQWATFKRDSKLAADEFTRRAREYDELRTSCITRANFSEIPCLMD